MNPGQSVGSLPVEAKKLGRACQFAFPGFDKISGQAPLKQAETLLWNRACV